MTLYLKQQEMYMDGKEVGIAEGMKKGIEKGMDMLAKAILLARKENLDADGLVAMGISEEAARQAVILK